MIHPVAQWGLLDSYDNGISPSVAITDDGLIVEAHAAPDNGSIWTRFATFPTDLTKPIQWTAPVMAFQGPVDSVSVDASRAGIVVIYTDNDSNLYRMTAPLPAPGAVTLSWGIPQSFDSGEFSNVTMNNSGDILFVHDTSKVLENGDLFYGWGTFGGGMSTGVPLPAPSGTSPTVAMNDAGQVIFAFADVNGLLNLMAGTWNAELFQLTCGTPVTSVATSANAFDVAIDSSNNFVVAVNDGWITGSIVNNVPLFTLPWSFPAVMTANSIALNSESQACYEANVSAGTENVAESAAFSSCAGIVDNGTYANWMQSLVASDPGVGDIPINLLAMPGSHDSGTYGIAAANDIPSNDDPWYYSLDTVIMADWAIAQSLSIFDQLSYGVRYLDLRVIQMNGTFFTCHGLFGATMQEVLSDIQNFCATVSNEILILDMNHLYDYQHQDVGGSIEMSEDNATLLCNDVLNALGNLVLDPSYYALSLNQIWNSSGFLSGGRVFAFTTSFVQSSFASRIGLSSQPAQPPAPQGAALASYWPNVASLSDLEASPLPSFLQAQSAVWSQYLSTRDASQIPFNVTQCIGTPGSSQVFPNITTGLFGSNTLIQWESQLCSSALFWLFGPAQNYASCLNIVLVDEVPQTIVTPACIAANQAKAAALAS